MCPRELFLLKRGTEGESTHLLLLDSVYLFLIRVAPSVLSPSKQSFPSSKEKTSKRIPECDIASASRVWNLQVRVVVLIWLFWFHIAFESGVLY
jgi:hypothetical protein